MTWLIGAVAPATSSGLTTFQEWGVPIIVAVVSGAVFYALGALTTVYLKQPRLQIIGGGSGGGAQPDSFYLTNVTVCNRPGRLGFTIGRTVVLGKTIFNKHLVGIPVSRDPAKGITGQLWDEKRKNVIGGAALHWQDPDDPLNRPVTLRQLESEQQASLFMMAQQNNDVPNYYIYEPDQTNKPIIPPVKLTGDRKVILSLTYMEGRKKQDIKFTILTDPRYGKVVVRQGWR